MSEADVVTGAFGYTGRHITARLVDRGRRVRTLTAHPNRAYPFGREVEVVPFNFDRPLELMESLRDVSTLYNTYWVRFPNGPVTFDLAVRNSKILFEAARGAGVRRVVHVSITNPREGSFLRYFAGKALVEDALMGSGLSYAIVRPTVMFGGADVLINNMAWLIRRLPVFALPGTGTYRLQPVHVEDVAELCIEAASGQEDTIIDAAGPEIFTFEELLTLIRDAVGTKCRLVHLPPRLALGLSRLVGRVVRDVVLTPEELRGLMSDLIVSGGEPTGRVRLSDWILENGQVVGRTWASELERHYR